MRSTQSAINDLPAKSIPKIQGCLSCGTTENINGKRYCSISCRQKLRHALNIRTGLLKALNIRYAVFYFTNEMIIMDVLPYGSKEIFSFYYPRSSQVKPFKDFELLCDMLGNAWWNEKKRTNRTYLATRFIFEKASNNSNNIKSLRPYQLRIPLVQKNALLHLKLAKKDLDSPQLAKIIKIAYRNQAKKHHPDLGGDSSTFRKIHKAYEELINWAENPTFISRRGFPDKWFYDGIRNKWVQPTPIVQDENLF